MTANRVSTFVSGQLFLWDSRANALVHASISRRTNKAAARACHRRYWPETNVGASAARDCAARAALDLTGAEDAPATLARNHGISHRVAHLLRLFAQPRAQVCIHLLPPIGTVGKERALLAMQAQQAIHLALYGFENVEAAPRRPARAA